MTMIKKKKAHHKGLQFGPNRPRLDANLTSEFEGVIISCGSSSSSSSESLRMLVKLASPTVAMSAFNSVMSLWSAIPDLATGLPNNLILSVNVKKWALCSSAQTPSITLSDDSRATWEACRKALSTFNLSVEEEDKILGKAFGYIHSPYWSEERKIEVPTYEAVNEIIEYLKSLSLSDDDLLQVLKKFPEVVGCSLEDGLKTNVRILEKDWGIQGKSLRKLLLRNPKVLGYNVDCKGDCIAKCTRCWVRF